MALTKAAITVLAPISAAAGTTRGAPGALGASVDCRAYYGGELTYKITNNGAAAPTAALTLVFQSSHDGVNWCDYQPVAGDLVAYNATTLVGVASGSILLDRGVMYLRAIAYGNATNAVTVEAYLQAVTAV